MMAKTRPYRVNNAMNRRRFLRQTVNIDFATDSPVGEQTKDLVWGASREKKKT